MNYTVSISILNIRSSLFLLNSVHLINSFKILKLLKLVGFQMMNMRDVSEFIYLLT
jgi:hypothetical protein